MRTCTPRWENGRTRYSSCISDRSVYESLSKLLTIRFLMRPLLNRLVATAVVVALFVGVVSPSDAAPLKNLVRTYATMKIVGKTVNAARSTRVLARAKAVRSYIREMETLSGHRISRKQFAEVRKCMQGKTPNCLDPSNAGQGLWKKERKRVFKEWEDANKQPWPRYANRVPGVNDPTKTIANVGTRWDGHHILPKEYGGPHRGWNIIPMPQPGHRNFIHRGM